jgi:hypothetical protein
MGNPGTPYNGTKLSIFDRLVGSARCHLTGNFADFPGKRVAFSTTISLNLVPFGTPYLFLLFVEVLSYIVSFDQAQDK